MEMTGFLTVLGLIVMDLYPKGKRSLERIQKTLLLPGLRVLFILQAHLAFHLFPTDLSYRRSLSDYDISPN